MFNKTSFSGRGLRCEKVAAAGDSRTPVVMLIAKRRGSFYDAR